MASLERFSQNRPEPTIHAWAVNTGLLIHRTQGDHDEILQRTTPILLRSGFTHKTEVLVHPRSRGEQTLAS